MTTQNEVNEHIQAKMRVYYENYYKYQLGLRDWQTRIESRLTEEKNLAEPTVSKIESWMGFDFIGKKVLVVGAGTGAEAVVLHQRGAEVFGIEPSGAALVILNGKAALYGIPLKRFMNATAEQIPFGDQEFDFVYCYTVLEHVQDIEKSISEMVRVCKVGGYVYIQTPDYRFPYEGHYKLDRPGFSSKWLTSLLFWLQRKPVRFLRSINFVNAPDLDKIFFTQNVLTIRVSPPWLREWNPVKNRRIFSFTKRTGIGKDQYIFLKKLG